MKRTIFLSLVLSFLTLGCGSTSVGLACTSNADCDDAQSCFTGAPGGYCSNGCFELGSNKDCPADSVCTDTTFGQVCARICGVHEDCRPDYECNGVSNSNAKSCRPKKA